MSELLFQLDGYARYLLYELRKFVEILTREGLVASLLRRIRLCLEIFHTTGSLTKSGYLLSSTMEAQAQLQLDLPKGVRLLSYLSLAIKLSGVRSFPLCYYLNEYSKLYIREYDTQGRGRS